ncbi:MAG TPA: zinc-binding dehydrogenase [Candidatus Polarisedimenticolia bacterium]|jgi:NADPH:quinone reductase-like Zn-dependent oxidoreductase|nr:zinc-binding dehydrogenase [Candidatus Polarisedimenticolia bacterium]
MRAVVVPRHGGPEVLEIATRPRPVPGAGEVLLQVMAAGVNHLDTFVRRGMPGITLPLPMIPGSDAAGVVAAAGPGVTGVKEGDRVFVSPGFSCERCRACLSGQEPLCRFYGLLGEHRDGTQAEFVVLRASQALPLPDSIPFEEAAAFPLVFLTAWHMLVFRAGIRPGEDVLIHAGGSGVGTAAIQIAKLHGARVLTTVGGAEKAAKARALGADEVIDHRTTDFLAETRRLTGKRGVDIVVENVGQETWEKSLLALARGGRLVTCGATTGYEAKTDLRHLFFKGLSLLGSTMGNRAELLQIAELVAAGRLRPIVDRVLKFEQAAEAHRLIAERAVFGKIVLIPGNPIA